MGDGLWAGAGEVRDECGQRRRRREEALPAAGRCVGVPADTRAAAAAAAAAFTGTLPVTRGKRGKVRDGRPLCPGDALRARLGGAAADICAPESENAVLPCVAGQRCLLPTAEGMPAMNDVLLQERTSDVRAGCRS